MKLLSGCPGAKEEATRNAYKLSSNNPSMIKELHQYRPQDLAMNLDGRAGLIPINLSLPALDVA